MMRYGQRYGYINVPLYPYGGLLCLRAGIHAYVSIQFGEGRKKDLCSWIYFSTKNNLPLESMIRASIVEHL